MMKSAKSIFLSLLLLCFMASMAWADGEQTFKSKCAGCHGANAEGKVGPNLKTTKLSQDDIVLLLSKGDANKKAPHKKALSGLSDEDIKAVAHYVKSLK